MRYSAIFSGLERRNQATKPQGEWGGNGEEKKLDSAGGFANKRKDRLATQFFFLPDEFFCREKTRGTRSDESLALSNSRFPPKH